MQRSDQVWMEQFKKDIEEFRGLGNEQFWSLGFKQKGLKFT